MQRITLILTLTLTLIVRRGRRMQRMDADAEFAVMDINGDGVVDRSEFDVAKYKAEHVRVHLSVVMGRQHTL